MSQLALTPDEAARMREHVKRWRASPADFAREQFRVEPDPAQLELFSALASTEPQHQRIAQQAAAGTAKTAGMAMGALWFMTCFGDRDWLPQGAAVSITEKNLRDNFVKELSMWRARSQLCQHLLDLNTERLALRGAEDRGFLSFRSFAQGADEQTIGASLSGLHGRYTLQIIDEAGAMSPAIGRTTEQARESGSVFCKVLASGNPVSNDGLLHEIATNLRHMWHLIVVTGDPDDPQRSPRVPLEKARTAIATYGRDNAWVRIYILGLFPLTALNKFLGPDDIQRAQKRSLPQHEWSWAQNRLGIDPARFGDDRTGFVRRQGRMMWDSQHVRGCDSGEIAALAAVMNMHTPFDVVIIDMGGENSGGVFDALKTAGLQVHAVYSASTKVPDPKFHNMRAYMHWQAAQWVKTGGQLPLDAALAREAMCPFYDFKVGKLIVEEKKDIKSRLGESPDLWDAACLTYALPDAPKGLALPPGSPMGIVESMQEQAAAIDDMPEWARELFAVNVRLADRVNLPALYRLVVAMVAEAPNLRDDGVDEESARAGLEALVDRGWAVVAQAPDGELVGFMFIQIYTEWWSRKTKASETGLYLAPAARGRMLANRLVAAAEARAEELGACQLKSGTDAGTATEAVCVVYARAGFDKTGATFQKRLRT